MTLTTPRSGETSTASAVAADVDTDHLRSKLEAQRATNRREGSPSAAVRANRIDRLIALITDNAEAISEALDADFGSRPRSANYVSDILGIMGDLNHTRTRIKRWMRPTRAFALGRLIGVAATVEHKPLGVVGIIGPWNFPIGLVVQPAAAAFAAGNRVMVKMSEVTPRVAALFAELVARYFDPEELTVVLGDVTVGAEFSSLPFDHLFFTGSPGVGAKVAEAAGRNLVPVTLELGGKNPAVVARGAKIGGAAERIVAARMSNGGQICLCPDYVFVPRESLDAFVNEALDAARAMFPTVAHNRNMVSIVNDDNFARVSGLIDDARAKGATVHQVVPARESLPDPVTRMIAPTVMTGMTDEMTIASEEVFGPVLSVLPYDDIAQVISYVADRPSPLAAYWFGPQGVAFDAFQSGTASGGMTINDYALHCAISDVPFGGVGRSGSGAYHGKTGFDTFSHARAIVKSRLPISLGKLTITPFSPRGAKIAESYLAREKNGAARRIGSFQRAGGTR